MPPVCAGRNLRAIDWTTRRKSNLSMVPVNLALSTSPLYYQLSFYFHLPLPFTRYCPLGLSWRFSTRSSDSNRRATAATVDASTRLRITPLLLLIESIALAIQFLHLLVKWRFQDLNLPCNSPSNLFYNIFLLPLFCFLGLRTSNKRFSCFHWLLV